MELSNKPNERALTMIQRNFMSNKDGGYQKMQWQGKEYAIQYRHLNNHHSIQPNISKASRTHENRSSKCAQLNVSTDHASPIRYVRVSTDSNVMGLHPEDLETPVRHNNQMDGQLQSKVAAAFDLSHTAKNKIVNTRAGLLVSDTLNAKSHHAKTKTLKEQLDQSQAYHLERSKQKVQDLLKRHYHNADHSPLHGQATAAITENKLLSSLSPINAHR